MSRLELIETRSSEPQEVMIDNLESVYASYLAVTKFGKDHTDDRELVDDLSRKLRSVLVHYATQVETGVKPEARTQWSVIADEQTAKQVGGIVLLSLEDLNRDPDSPVLVQERAFNAAVDFMNIPTELLPLPETEIEPVVFAPLQLEPAPTHPRSKIKFN